MVWLPDSEKTVKIRLLEHDRRTDRQQTLYGSIGGTCTASRGKNGACKWCVLGPT